MKRGFTLVELFTVSKRAFTLVELLVVVAIIVILIALLIPGIDKAIEQTRRAVCMSRLHVFGLSHTQYALDNRRKLAPGWAATGQPGSQQNAIWHADNVVNGIVVPGPAALTPGVPPYGNFREIGHLSNIGYQPKPHKSLYCPDMKANLFDGTDTLRWPVDNNLPATGYPWVHSHYNYRTTYEPQFVNNTFTGRALKLSDPGRLTLHVDYFTYPSTLWSHNSGFNASHLDGSAGFVHDPSDEIRHAFDPLGYFGGGQELMNQEKAYETFFDRAYDGRE